MKICHPAGKQTSVLTAKMRVAAVRGHGLILRKSGWRLSLYRAGRLKWFHSTANREGTVIPAHPTILHTTSRPVRSLKGAEAMKKKKKPNPKSIPVTKADLERAKKQATHEACEMAWAIMFSVLRDKEGLEYTDLRRIWTGVCDLSESITNGYATIPDLKHVLKLEIGAELV